MMLLRDGIHMKTGVTEWATTKKYLGSTVGRFLLLCSNISEIREVRAKQETRRS
jgi:hypothetical protein